MKNKLSASSPYEGVCDHTTVDRRGKTAVGCAHHGLRICLVHVCRLEQVALVCVDDSSLQMDTCPKSFVWESSALKNSLMTVFDSHQINLMNSCYDFAVMVAP